MSGSGDFEQQLVEIANALESADNSYHAGRFDEAAPTYERALGLLEQAFGRLDPDTIACLQKLAEARYLSARYDQALPLYKRLLSVGQEVLGPNHADVKGMSQKVEEISQILAGQAGLGVAPKAGDDRAARMTHSSIDALRPDNVSTNDWNADWRSQQYEQSRKSRGLEYEKQYQAATEQILEAARNAAADKLPPQTDDDDFPNMNMSAGRGSKHSRGTKEKRPDAGKVRKTAEMKPTLAEANSRTLDMLKSRAVALVPTFLVLTVLGIGTFFLLKLGRQATDTPPPANQPQMLVKKFATADGARQVELVANDKAVSEVRLKYAGVKQPLSTPFLEIGPDPLDFLKATLSCLSKKDIWFEETKEGLRDEKGVVYYALNAPEFAIVNQMRKIKDSATKWYYGGTGYPTKAEYVNSFPYVNPFAGANYHPKLTFHRLATPDGRMILMEPGRGDPNLYKSLQAPESSLWLMEPALAPGEIHCLSVQRDYENPAGRDFYIHCCDRNGKLIYGSDPSKVLLVGLHNGNSLEMPIRDSLPTSKSRLVRFCLVKLPPGTNLLMMRLLFPCSLMGLGFICLAAGYLTKPNNDKGFLSSPQDILACLLLVVGMFWTYFLFFAQ